MSLLQEQFAFSKDVAALFLYLIDHGFNWSLGEALRTEYQQAEYVRTGRSKTSNSQHLKKLAIDLNIFKDGMLCNAAQLKGVGDYWEGLSPLNRWGGSWRGLVEAGKSSFVDSPHFERYV